LHSGEATMAIEADWYGNIVMLPSSDMMPLNVQRIRMITAQDTETAGGGEL